ncbi:MAG: ankyrin repeat domain-containing protein, partial [Planctomycetota bacterium]
MKNVKACIFVIALLVVYGQIESQSMAEEQTVDIWTAVATGNIEAIKKNLVAGVDVNATFVQPGVPGSGGTPLHIAVIAGQMDAAKLLLEKGANIEAKAADEHQATPLHWAAFVGRLESIKFLLEKGAKLNAKDKNGYTPLDSASYPVEGIPDKSAVVAFLRKQGGKSKEDSATKTTTFRGSYFVNGEIHVNTYGTPEGKPLTTGHQDFKPSWSKTGNMLVFFRRLKNHPVTVMWKTAICIINVDGTGFHKLTDGT